MLQCSGSAIQGSSTQNLRRNLQTRSEGRPHTTLGNLTAKYAETGNFGPRVWIRVHLLCLPAQSRLTSGSLMNSSPNNPVAAQNDVEPSSDSFRLPSSGFRLPELLAPAGDWECAKAAVENGADA